MAMPTDPTTPAERLAAWSAHVRDNRLDADVFHVAEAEKMAADVRAVLDELSEIRRRAGIALEKLGRARGERELAAHFEIACISDTEWVPIPGTNKWRERAALAAAKEKT